MNEDKNSYWAKQVRRYDRAALLLNRHQVVGAQWIAAKMEGCRDILEVAAGTGLFTEHVLPGTDRYVATDRSPDMLEALRRRAGAAPQLEVREADVLALPWDDESFDGVLMANLLHLLPEPRRALIEVRRVLRPGGRLAAPTYCHGRGLVAKTASRILGLAGFPIVTRFAGEDLDVAVTRAGFEVEDVQWFPGLLPIRGLIARCS